MDFATPTKKRKAGDSMAVDQLADLGATVNRSQNNVEDKVSRLQTTVDTMAGEMRAMAAEIAVLNR